MSRKLLLGILSAEALACAVFTVMRVSFLDAFSSILAFPFEQIGAGLRALSLSGAGGNAAALVLYVAAGAVPLVPFIVRSTRRKLHFEDGLLVLLSAALFVALYMMINPGMIVSIVGGAAGLPVGRAVLGGIVYSVFAGYLVLRVLRLFSSGSTDKLTRYMSAVLWVMGALFVYMAFGSCLQSLLGSIADLRAGNIGNEDTLGASTVFLWLQFIVSAAPYLLDVAVILAALRLLGEMRKDRYSEGTVAAAGGMAGLCLRALTATVLMNVGFNLMQLLFAGSLRVLNATVQLPVLSILFVLTALLLSRLVSENKQLKDDNDGFI